MTEALSPREIPERLHATEVTPRRTRSKFEVIAGARGYTMKAGADTRARLSTPTFKRTPRPVRKAEDVPVRYDDLSGDAQSTESD